ncbi:MAG: aromatic-amino-acid transaminase [Candidatus Paceibacteria bacterium]
MSSTITNDPLSALIESVTQRPSDDPIFSLNAEARRRAAAGESILNATLGALVADDGRLVVPPSVEEAYARVPLERSSAYAPISGPPEFLQAVIRDLFGESELAANATAVATAGGTGAILHSLVTFLDVGQTLLTTNYFWSPYRIIASHTRRAVETFEMFNEEGGFNLRAFEASLVAQITRQGRSLVILNFPCHNPTGYSLSLEEWAGLTEIIERHGSRGPITILFDVAYAKFGAAGSERWIEFLDRISRSAQVLVSWSASKSFAQYGARVGALVALHRDDAERGRIANALSYACRGTWSNCNHQGMLAITELLTQPDLMLTYATDLKDLVELLNRRVEVFNKEAAGLDLDYPRYEGGFFVTIFNPRAEEMAAAMRDEGVFVVPLEGAVRIALCATPEAEVPRLVKSLLAGVAATEDV